MCLIALLWIEIEQRLWQLQCCCLAVVGSLVEDRRLITLLQIRNKLEKKKKKQRKRKG
jgi:hypothetical protein